MARGGNDTRRQAGFNSNMMQIERTLHEGNLYAHRVNHTDQGSTKVT